MSRRLSKGGATSAVRSIVAALKQCAESRDMERGQRIHSQVIDGGMSSRFVDTALINMYSKCGCISQARNLFDHMPHRDSAAWNSLLQAYAQNGYPDHALHLFDSIPDDKKDARTYLIALSAWQQKITSPANSENSELKQRAESIHLLAMHNNCSDVHLESALITFYSKLGRMDLARGVFDKMNTPNVVTWTALIHGYVEAGENHLALQLFDQMNSPRSPRTYALALAACSALARVARSKSSGGSKCLLEKARSIQYQAMRDHCGCIFVSNRLIEVFSACGSLPEAARVFEMMSQLNVISWNFFMQGCLDNRRSDQALHLFLHEMDPSLMNSGTFVIAAAAVVASSSSSSPRGDLLELGREIHSRAIESGCWDEFLESSLIRMYSACGSIGEAGALFDKVAHQGNVVVWTTMIQALGESGDGGAALELFDRMHENRILPPTEATFVAAIQACSSADVDDPLKKLKRIRSKARESGCCGVIAATALINLFSRCSGGLIEACEVFSEIETCGDSGAWNSILQCLVENQEPEAALELFHRCGSRKNSRSYGAAIAACSGLGGAGGGLEKGREIHREALENNACDFPLQNSLIAMYSRCGSMADARGVFDSMDSRDAGSWSSLIRGYIENGENHLALELIPRLDQSGVGFTTGAFVAALQACGSLMAGEIGRDIHLEIIAQGSEREPVLASCLIDFHSKCGDLGSARSAFDSVPEKDLWLWNTLLGGYSRRGEGRKALELLEEMKRRGMNPNGVTLTLILSACSHSGLTGEGMRVFQEMITRYGIRADRMHFNSVVDLLARGNYLDEAMAMIGSMPFEPNAVTWNTLLAACRNWSDAELGRFAFESLIRLDAGESASGYNLMANIYSAPT